MFARFDENPAMTLQEIKETKRYAWTHGQKDNVKAVYPPQTKFAGGITISSFFSVRINRRKTLINKNKKSAKVTCSRQ